MKLNIFEHKGRKMYEYHIKRPGVDYVLTLNDPNNPTDALFYVWAVYEPWLATMKADVETITRRPIKMAAVLATWYNGNGHGGFKIEFEGESDV